jgi:hypothetical protein
MEPGMSHHREAVLQGLCPVRRMSIRTPRARSRFPPGPEISTEPRCVRAGGAAKQTPLSRGLSSPPCRCRQRPGPAACQSSTYDLDRSGLLLLTLGFWTGVRIDPQSGVAFLPWVEAALRGVPVGGDHAVVVGEYDRGGAVAHAELCEDAADVGLHCRLGDI